MKSINFSTGIKEYIVNGDDSTIIRINLNDLNIAKRIEEVEKNLDAMLGKFADVEQPTLGMLAEADTEIRKQLNYAFDTDISTPAFGSLNVMSPVDGKPLCVLFLEAFMPIIKADMETMLSSKVRPEVKKYLPGKDECQLDIDSMTVEEKNALLQKLLS